MPDRYAVWLDRDTVTASGPEAASFLQGQLSQDVEALGAWESAWSWVLSPQGKIDALVRVTRLSDDDWLIDTDKGWGESLVQRLNRFKLRTKVEFAVAPWKVLGLRGPGSSRLAVDGALVTVAAWPGVDGVDAIGPDPSPPEGWQVIGGSDYESVRILSRMPKMGAELDDRTIPAETGIVPLTVSFTKGCYTGQELVARVDSRGSNVPRRLRLMRMSGPLSPGAELTADGVPAGALTSVAQEPGGGWVGLGYIKRGVDVAASLVASPPDPDAARVVVAVEESAV